MSLSHSVPKRTLGGGDPEEAKAKLPLLKQLMKPQKKISHMEQSNMDRQAKLPRMQIQYTIKHLRVDQDLSFHRFNFIII